MAGGPIFDRAPRRVYWEVTRACDLACRHCRAEAAPEPDPGELGPEEGRQLLDDLTRFGPPLPHLVLTGGDPLKRADLFPLIEAARARGFAVSVAPSGTPLFTAAAVRRLVAAGVEAISLSLDGSTAAHHDRLRGVPGCFERTLMAARECAAAGLPFQVNTLVSEETLGDLPAIHGLASSLGALRWSLFFLVAVGRGSVLRPITAEAAEELFEQLLELAGRAGPAVTTTEAPHFRRVATERGGRQGGGPGERHRAIGHSAGIPRRQRHHVHLSHRPGLSLGVSAAVGGQCEDGGPRRAVPWLGSVPRPPPRRGLRRAVRALRVPRRLRRLARPRLGGDRRSPRRGSALPLRAGGGARE